MIGEIWDYITDGFSQVWEAVTSIPSLLSGVNMSGFLVLTLIGEAIVIIGWFATLSYYKSNSAYEAIKAMFSISNLIIAIVVTPILCYVIGNYYANKGG